MSHQKPDGHVTESFAEFMCRLAEAWGINLSEGRIRVYAAGLSDIPLDRIKSVCSKLVRDSQFFPTVAAIRAGIEATPEDAGVLAWAALRKAAADVGAWTTVTIQDGAAAAALDAVFGSWPEFCALEDGPALHTRRQEFLAAYRVARWANASPARLRGLCEATGKYEPTRSLAAVVTPRGITSGVDADLQTKALEKLR